jgi:hypothetical protein
VLRFMPRICVDEGCERGKKEEAVPAREGSAVDVLDSTGIDGLAGDRESIDIDLRAPLLA